MTIHIHITTILYIIQRLTNVLLFTIICRVVRCWCTGLIILTTHLPIVTITPTPSLFTYTSTFEYIHIHSTMHVTKKLALAPFLCTPLYYYLPSFFNLLSNRILSLAACITLVKEPNDTSIECILRSHISPF